MELMPISVESYKRIEKELAQFYMLQYMLFPFTPEEELKGLTAKDLKDAINARIKEGQLIL